MAGPQVHLRLDPWPAEYESALHFDEVETEPLGTVDADVETKSWDTPIRPSKSTDYSEAFFVDGVRRVEARVTAEQSGQLIHGLFGSVATGGVNVRGDVARFVSPSVERFLILGSGLQSSESLQIGSLSLNFEGLSCATNSPDDILGELQNAMRTREALLAAAFSTSDACVFADGPLTYFATVKQIVIGVIKAIYRTYLPLHLFALVSKLPIGTRTPIFAIQDGKYDRYSWFLRVADGRVIDHPLVGVMRLEVRTAVGIANALCMADFATTFLPRFASTQARDPRAPQNLVPIGALETELRRRMGDAVLLRRAIEMKLLTGVTV